MSPTATAATGLALGLALLAPRAAGDESLFREQVAPILEARCVGCHNAATAKAKLSLATAASALAGGDSGPAIVPGRPDESPLIEQVEGPEPAMPKSGPKLAEAEVETLRRWVEAGAPWPEGVTLRDRKFEGETWWSLRPLTRPPLPDRPEPNPIDAFVRARLAEAGLEPSPEADRRTLIRRLTFDLTGLPPTPEEVDAFVADTDVNAYENLVDRLLASPRHGERWGRHWLDVVHYGDTHGYDKDKRRDHAWRYRDWVIGALNDDLPYGQFVREQLAGDALRPGDPRGLIATGFIAAGPWDFVGHVELREGTVDKEKTRLIDRDDMLASAMSTFNSLTVHCARCHDHKFDPIPQRDYYALQAVFAGVDRGDRTFDGPELAARRAELARRKADHAARLAAVEKRVEAATTPELAALDAEIARLRAEQAALPAPSGPPSPTNGYHSAIEPKADTPKWVQVDLGRSAPIDEVRLIPARPTDFPDTPGFGFPARLRVELADDPAMANARVLADHRDADLPTPGDEPLVVRAEGARGRYLRVTAERLWKRTNDYVFALGELQVLSGDADLAAGAAVSALDSIEAGRWGKAALVDGFSSRVKLPDPADPAARHRAELAARLGQAARDRIRLAEQALDPSLRAERDALAVEAADLDRAAKELPAPEKVYAIVSHAPRPIRVLNRGEVEQPGEPASPGALSCVPGLESAFDALDPDDEAARRLALADWLASDRNPLTWRSIVNRVWHYHFGRGLVDTPNDFGRNGSTPTHPELLDWLAADFRDGGQSLKALHRRIVTSATYRQASAEDARSARVDAENRLLWRQNRRRLEAEAVRDAVLAASGSLDLTMGGPAFELFRFKDDHSPIYDHTDPARIDAPEGRRRAVYRFIVRSVPNPFLDCLDAADPNTHTPVRSQTITALQALAMLNDPFMLAQAGRFADRVAREAGADLDRQVDRAFRLALSRPPDAAERAELAAYAAEHGTANACRLLFNANEFLFVD